MVSSTACSNGNLAKTRRAAPLTCLAACSSVTGSDVERFAVAAHLPVVVALYFLTQRWRERATDTHG